MPHSVRRLQTQGKEGWGQKRSLSGASRPGQITSAFPNVPARDRTETEAYGKYSVGEEENLTFSFFPPSPSYFELSPLSCCGTSLSIFTANLLLVF